ncbi:MAG: TolC family protein [Planctomycetota bacterium]
MLRLCLGLTALGVCVSCVEVRPEVRVYETMSLVEQHTGHRPAWLSPWDDLPPAEWDGRGVLAEAHAVELALRNNRALRAEVERIGMANADLVQAGLLTNPVISFMVMFPLDGGRSMLRGPGFPMVALQDLWLIPARENVARGELQQAILRVSDLAVETAQNVRRVYARLQYTQRALELIGENITLVEQTTKIVQARQTAGRATQVELNLSLIRQHRLRSDLLAMEAEHRRLKRELLMLVGFAAASDDWAVAPMHEIETAVRPPAPEEQLVGLGTLQRLDLKASEWEVRSADRRVALATREAWPDFALGLSFERAEGARMNTPGVASTLGTAAAAGAAGAITGMPAMPPGTMRERADEPSPWMLGPMLELEIPIFDQNQAQIARAVHERRRAEAEYEARLQEITRDVRAARILQQQAYEQVLLYRNSILPDVQRNLELAQQTYIGGQEDLAIFFQVQEDVIATRLRTLELLRDYAVYLADLQRAVGGPLELPGEAPALPASPPPTSAPASAPEPEAEPPPPEDADVRE